MKQVQLILGHFSKEMGETAVMGGGGGGGGGQLLEMVEAAEKRYIRPSSPLPASCLLKEVIP